MTCPTTARDLDWLNTISKLFFFGQLGRSWYVLWGFYDAKSFCGFDWKCPDVLLVERSGRRLDNSSGYHTAGTHKSCHSVRKTRVFARTQFNTTSWKEEDVFPFQTKCFHSFATGDVSGLKKKKKTPTLFPKILYSEGQTSFSPLGKCPPAVVDLLGRCFCVIRPLYKTQCDLWRRRDYLARTCPFKRQ